VKPLGPTELKRLHRSWQRRTTGRVALLLENVQTPWNVGAISRTAAALRVDHLYLAGTTVAPSHPKAGKTAMGTERYLEWSRHHGPVEAAEAAHGHGFSIVALELASGAQPLFELDLGGGTDVCLALGHEDHGLSAACLAGADRVAFIPQLGRVGSLNVAVAAAIGLYELRRRQWVGSGPGGIDLDP
jgi:tRNA (guanosine-2'-O-)-methyltransferase